MQHTPSHHWFSSLLTGLCIVAGFGLGLSWQEWHSKGTTDTERTPATSPLAEQPTDNAVLCSAVLDDEDQDKDKDKEKAKPKPRPRVFVGPNMTEDHMKRVEEALRRAQEALEKDGTPLPEDFRKHFDNLRKQMQEHHKLMEKHLKEMEKEFPNFRGFEGFPKGFDQFPNWQGFEGFPKQGGLFRFPENMDGEGVSIMMSRDNGNFTVERREGSQSIKVTGSADDGANSITIKDGSKEKTYKNIKDVPADHQGRVKELIEMGTTGRLQVHPQTPKKDSKSDKKKDYF